MLVVSGTRLLFAIHLLTIETTSDRDAVLL